ncbi:MAG: hypothetical protein GU362_06225 [Thaumarchaeota archaeon]|jgi:hypothetical protein|nr:hypothetical protein [Nitrososphaerota archaeon]
MIKPLTTYYDIIPPKEQIPGLIGFVQNQVYTLPKITYGFIVVYSGVLFKPEYKDFMFETKQWNEHFWYDMNEFGRYVEQYFGQIYRKYKDKAREKGGLITEFSHAIFSLGYDRKRKAPLFLYVKNGALVLDKYVKKNFPQHEQDLQNMRDETIFKLILLLFLLALPLLLMIAWF